MTDCTLALPVGLWGLGTPTFYQDHDGEEGSACGQEEDARHGAEVIIGAKALNSASLTTAIALISAILGTIPLCRPVNQTRGVIAWMVSLISLLRLLEMGRADPRYLVARFFLASVAVFCLLMLVIMRPLGTVGLVFAVVGVVAAGAFAWIRLG
jgi:hypothetical protein